MPATVVIDEVADTQLNIDRTRVTFVRTGHVKGLDTTLTPALIMASAVAAPGMPAQYSGHPAYSYALLNRYAFTTATGVNNKVYFKLFYDTQGNPGAGGLSIFTLEHNRYLSNVETQLHPKDKSPLQLYWQNPADATQKGVTQTATVSYLQPMLSITASGYIIGQPPAGYYSAFGRVNATPWQGYPMGYFLYLGASDKTQDFGHSYNVKLEFLSKVTEDWSSYAIYRDHSTGLNLPVKTSDASLMRNAPYEYGTGILNGILKTGLYDLAEFNTIFGF